MTYLTSPSDSGLPSIWYNWQNSKSQHLSAWLSVETWANLFRPLWALVLSSVKWAWYFYFRDTVRIKCYNTCWSSFISIKCNMSWVWKHTPSLLTQTHSDWLCPPYKVMIHSLATVYSYFSHILLKLNHVMSI